MPYYTITRTQRIVKQYHHVWGESRAQLEALYDNGQPLGQEPNYQYDSRVYTEIDPEDETRQAGESGEYHDTHQYEEEEDIMRCLLRDMQELEEDSSF